MKIVQINLIGRYQSTGRTMLELHDFLISKGLESIMVYGHGPKPSGSFEYRVVGKFGYYFHNILARLFGSQGWHSKFETKKLIKFLNRESPDVIHIRNLHGNFIHQKTFLKYLSEYKGKVVWTTHDFWLLTGSCPMLDCSKWKDSCGLPCPFINKFPFARKKYVYKNFELHKTFFEKSKNLQIQANSLFASDILSRSIAASVPKTIVYNWIDCKSFVPVPRSENSMPIIQAAWSILDKNSPRFIRFIEFAKEFQSYYIFRMLGKNINFDPREYPFIDFVPPTNNKSELADFYSSGDVFLDTSYMDTFGKVVAESLACGTPAIVFDKGALPELIGPDCGYVLPVNSTNDEINAAIKKLLNNPHYYYEVPCRLFAKNNFDYEKNCGKLIKMYL